jgi:hypothetical protein
MKKKPKQERATGAHSAFFTLHSALRRGGRVVYCGGLENRFGFTADGGSNPSLSATAGWISGLVD